jgi:hypothetical protein
MGAPGAGVPAVSLRAETRSTDLLRPVQQSEKAELGERIMRALILRVAKGIRPREQDPGGAWPGGAPHNGDYLKV